MAEYSKYYDSDPNWEQYYQRHPLYAPKADPRQVLPLNIEADRTNQAVVEADWAKKHPLEDFGYTARYSTIKARDGYDIGVKTYHPVKASRSFSLPLLFITHGGGWVQGTYITEEAWLLYPILQKYQFTMVSVDYRLAPEYKYPYYANDCWDAFENVAKRSDVFEFDPKRIFVAGSSAGGCSAAVLAQKGATAGFSIRGAILNVPVTCHPDHFPVNEYEYTSYDQCFGSLLSSREMREVWSTVVPNAVDGKSPDVSPLLGEVNGLPPHLIFVAGQDPLRDEGLAYAEKLKRAGVKVNLHIYQGVPHTFADISELTMTDKFHEDLVKGVEELLQ